MLRLLLITTTLLLYSCSKPSLAPKLECWDREYIIDDLGKYVTISDFDITFNCDYGSIEILDEGGSTLLYLKDQQFPGFEMEIDFFPDEFEISFKADTYWLRVYVTIDSDLRTTVIHELSNLCGCECN